MIRLAFHLVQLVVHVYFIQWTYLYNEERSLLVFWNQTKFLTNFSNLQIFVFLVPFIIKDIQNIRVKDYHYSHLTTLFFQSMNSVMFIVTFMYWFLLFLDPKLLFGDRDPSAFPFWLMFYLHGGSFIIMQFEYLLYPQPQVHHLDKALWFFTFTLAYFMVYGIHFYLFNEHVYGFQKLMNSFQLVIMYTALFIVMFLIDLFYTAILHKTIHKQKGPRIIRDGNSKKIR